MCKSSVNDIALYIHIPFCRHKCSYCSFVSYPDRENDIPAYINALKQELILNLNGQNIKSIYFGGGTPSLLSSEQIGDILTVIQSCTHVSTMAEITIEINPRTINEPYLAAVRKLGINRVSFGIQSFSNKELNLLGRIHTNWEAIESIRFARNTCFTNINIDLIYGLPGQTLIDWQNTLIKAIDLNPEHLSLYCLSLEENTPLQIAIEQGNKPHINSELCADEYEVAEDILEVHGYEHYEISNWAKPGYECRHNMVYWKNEDYIGVGIAAHSHRGNKRYANTRELDKYLVAFTSNIAPKQEFEETITQDMQLSEEVILGLRLNQGVSLNNILGKYGMDITQIYGGQIAELINLGLLERSNGHIRLTASGRLLSNEVFWRFLPI